MDDAVSIAILGDLFPNARFFRDGKSLSPTFDETLDLLQTFDLRFGNFLMPLSERGAPTEKLANIRAHPDIATDVAELDLDAVSLANNHALDYGPEALADTMSSLGGIGVQVIGAGTSLVEAVRPVFFERNGIRIALVAYSCLVPPGAAATNERAGISPIRVLSSYAIDAQWAIEEPGEPEMVRICTWTDGSDQRRAEKQIADLKADADVVLASIHWGYGASELLADYQVPLAHAVIDAGADAILGHHVHAVQGVEVYKGRPIFYSPGTFVGRQIPEDAANLTDLGARLIAAMSPNGYLTRLIIDRSGVKLAEIVPTTLDDHGLPALSQGQIAEQTIERIRRLSAQFGTGLEWKSGRLAVQL
jgi:poly-gamma-glutamate synthesis protein (capsule biosynthesis protein)